MHYTASGIITLKQSEWSKSTKIQFYKYEQIVVKFMCELGKIVVADFAIFFPKKKNPKILTFMKIRPVGVQLFHADRQTDRHDDANSRVSQFCE